MLYFLAWPLPCKWYVVMVRCITTSNMPNAAKRLLVNCTLLSVRRHIGLPYGTSQCLRKRFAMCIDVNLDVGIARVSLEYRSMKIRMCWLRYVVFGNLSRLFVAMNLRGPAAGKS